MSQQELHEIRKNLTRTVKRARAIQRIVHTSEFEEAWGAVSAEIKQEAMGYINGNNRERLIQWVRDHAPVELGMKSLRELRELGKRYGIAYCSRMDKGTLLTEIANHERRKSTGNGSPAAQKVACGDAAVDVAGWASAGDFGPTDPES
jgi:hypothetical protein